MNARVRFPVLFSAAFSVVFLVLYTPRLIGVSGNGLFAHLEDLWQDRMFRLFSGSLKQGDPRIIIAAMDDDTGKRYGFPLPRDVHARLLDKLKGYGARAVVFDVMFFEAREHDAELIAATRRFGRVVHLFQTETQETSFGDVVSIHQPIAGLAGASQFLGYPNVDAVLDQDGHLRRAMLFDPRTHDLDGSKRAAPSMDAAALASYLGLALEQVYASYGQPTPKTLLLKFRRPREMLLHQARDASRAGKVQNLERLRSAYETISYMDLLAGSLTREQKARLKGALIMIGSTSIGYFDHYPTPFVAETPGAEFHCNILDNLLNGDFMRPVGRGWMLLVVLGVIWLPVLLLGQPPAVGAAAAGGVFALWFCLCAWMFHRDVRLEFVAPSVALLAAFLVQTVHRVLTEGQEKRFIKNLFGQFVAPEVVDDLARDPGKVKLGGEKRDMTIFFLDIAHFTTISEKMSPEALILFLNRYLSALSQVVHEQRGVVDKYIGDCIMAFWNAPISLADHRARACLAAIDCQRMMDRLNAQLDHGMPETPAIRIGLNSGDATVGLTGSEKKLQYTVIGDEVNLASRLEGANKFFGSRIMASEATYLGAKEQVEARELGRVRVVGKALPVRVFELLARRGELSAEWKEAMPHYERGIAHFLKREYSQAVAAFEEVVKIFPKDGPANLYLNASRDYAAIPPEEDWDGVFNLTAK